MTDKTKVAVDIFNKNATQYQEKYMDVSMYDESFQLFCNHIKKKNAKVLELACGPGNITKHLLNIRPDFKILGTDLAPSMIELAKVNNPSADFQIMDCRDLNTINKKYDAIMCGFCLPYLSKGESIQLIQDSYNILNARGIIYISTMEDDYSKSEFKSSSSNPQEKIFMHYHQEDYLVAALVQNGFDIISIERNTIQINEDNDNIDLIIIAKK